MSTGANLEIDCFVIVLLFIVYFSCRSSGRHISIACRFRVIVLLTIGVLAADGIAWSVNGASAHTARAVLWIANMAYYVLSNLIAVLWLNYTCRKLDLGGGLSVVLKILIGLPSVIFMALILIAPVTGLLFDIDSGNHYIRGPLFFLQALVSFGYLVAAAIVALCHMKSEPLRQRKIQCLWLSSFTVLPLLGGVVQTFIYGTSLVWPCTALSLVLVYMNLQNQQISVDALTGLNNRGQLDRYLLTRCTQDHGDEVFLFLCDVDEFKHINDVYGHVEGDAALISAAGLMKRAFCGTDAFLARYGGDEFAAVLRCESPRQADAALDRLEAVVCAFNNQMDRPVYPIVFSIGCAGFDPDEMESPADLIAAADREMYAQKRLHKARREAGKMS